MTALYQHVQQKSAFDYLDYSSVLDQHVVYSTAIKPELFVWDEQQHTDTNENKHKHNHKYWNSKETTIKITENRKKTKKKNAKKETKNTPKKIKNQ